MACALISISTFRIHQSCRVAHVGLLGTFSVMSPAIRPALASIIRTHLPEITLYTGGPYFRSSFQVKSTHNIIISLNELLRHHLRKEEDDYRYCDARTAKTARDYSNNLKYCRDIIYAGSQAQALTPTHLFDPRSLRMIMLAL